MMVLLLHFVGNTVPTNAFERVLVGVTNYGSYGVELFFVLSGFLITGILVDNFQKPHYFRNFYMRRVLRIFPLYYGVLVLVFFVAPLVPLLRGPTLTYLSEHQLWAWLYGVNVFIARSGTWSFSYLDHFWSLAVEEHFYLFWPLVVFALALRPRVLVAVCFATALCAISARIVGSLMGLSWWTTYVFTPFRFDGLALGAFIAVVMRQHEGPRLLLRSLPRVAGIASLLLAITFLWTRMRPDLGLELALPVRAALILVLLACFLVWAINAPERAATSRFLRSRSMVFLGTYSYGLYVYHHFISYYLMSNRTVLELARWLGSHTIAVVLQAALGAAASIAIAYVSYELFEKRFLELKRRFEAPKEPAAKGKALPGMTRPYVSSTQSG